MQRTAFRKLTTVAGSATIAGATAALDFAACGPLWPRLQRALGGSMPPADEWCKHGEAITENLTGKAMPVDMVDEATASRVYHLYLPIYFFARAQVRAHADSGGRGALAIGLSAPQGCGKTTLVDTLIDRFAEDGLTCAAASFDDFYLRGGDQDALASANPSNPLWQVRGNAGTHDLPLGSSVLRALKRDVETNGGASNGTLRIPRYDKALRGGRGDRAAESSWQTLPSPAHVILFEGWMAGFAPLASDASVLSAHAGLPDVNEQLGAYAAWHELMDSWIVLATSDISLPYRWRLEAERAMAAEGRPGMTDEQVADFVSRYMPAYEAYVPGLYAAAEGGGVFGKPTLLVKVDHNRAPIA
jgi:D-glycerate 3-kinase